MKYIYDKITKKKYIDKRPDSFSNVLTVSQTYWRFLKRPDKKFQIIGIRAVEKVVNSLYSIGKKCGWKIRPGMIPFTSLIQDYQNINFKAPFLKIAEDISSLWNYYNYFYTYYHFKTCGLEPKFLASNNKSQP